MDGKKDVTGCSLTKEEDEGVQCCLSDSSAVNLFLVGRDLILSPTSIRKAMCFSYGDPSPYPLLKGKHDLSEPTVMVSFPLPESSLDRIGDKNLAC